MTTFMGRTMCALVAVVFLWSCTRQTSARDYANRFITAETKAWSTGDLGDLKALEADDIVFHLAGMDLKGWKAHEEFIVTGRQTVSELKQNWRFLSGDANFIVLDYSSNAVLKADDKNPSQATSNTYLFVLRLEDEKVAEIWVNGSAVTRPVNPASN